MFRGKTLFILGAGASCEVGLPTGAQLTKQIANLLNIRFEELSHRPRTGDPIVAEAIRQGTNARANEHYRAARMISRGMSGVQSIDSFIEAHSDSKEVQLCGKLAIVRCILDAESHSALRINPSPRGSEPTPFNGLESSWFPKFFHMAMDGIHRTKVASISNQVSIINFNYDRCVETFIDRALQNVYGIDSATSHSIMKECSIYHPYGVVGASYDPTNDTGLHFGQDVSPQQLFELSSNIRTYSEQIEDRFDLEKIWTAIAHATQIIFMGFAFHRQNMKLLTPPEKFHLVSGVKHIYTTGVDMSDANRDAIKAQILGMANFYTDTAKITLAQSLNCKNLLDDFSKPLTVL